VVDAPEGWEPQDVRRVGPFVTSTRFRLPDGTVRTWASRRYRKVGVLVEERRERGHPWIRPRQLGWWVAALFVVGSFLFGLGSFPPYAGAVSATADALTYAVGSVFFTAAGALQFLQTVRTPGTLDGAARRAHPFWQPDRIDWWASGVQSIGTVLFNLSTFHVLTAASNAQSQDRLVWAPDMLGSVCFMIASTLAWLEVSGGWWAWRPSEIAWRIVALNLAGSIAFQISAIAAFVSPSTGELVNLPIANLGTFVGALCFLVGAVLLVPELNDA
jgi:hypothetical protein